MMGGKYPGPVRSVRTVTSSPRPAHVDALPPQAYEYRRGRTAHVTVCRSSAVISEVDRDGQTLTEREFAWWQTV